MLRHDAAALRNAAAPLAVVTALVTLVAAVTAGGQGALGAVVGAVLVALFFGVDHVVVHRMREAEPLLTMGVVMALYPLKLIVLTVLMLLLLDVATMSMPAFAVSVVLGTTGWLAGHVHAVTSRRQLHVGPGGLSWR